MAAFLLTKGFAKTTFDFCYDIVLLIITVNLPPIQKWCCHFVFGTRVSMESKKEPK